MATERELNCHSHPSRWLSARTILYSMDLLNRNQNSFALKRAMQNDSRWLCDNRLRQLTWNASSNTGGIKGFSVTSSVETSFTEYKGGKMPVADACVTSHLELLSSTTRQSPLHRSTCQVSVYAQAKR